MGLSEMYHVGIVVPDVNAARERLTALLGVTWGPVMEIAALELRDADGRDLVLPNRMCYSTAPPYLELVEEVPGSPWVCNEHSNLHHLAFTSDAVGDDSDAWATAGCPRVLGSRRDGAIWTAYHDEDSLRVRIELVSQQSKDVIVQTMCIPESSA